MDTNLLEHSYVITCKISVL